MRGRKRERERYKEIYKERGGEIKRKCERKTKRERKKQREREICTIPITMYIYNLKNIKERERKIYRASEIWINGKRERNLE